MKNPNKTLSLLSLGCTAVLVCAALSSCKTNDMKERPRRALATSSTNSTILFSIQNNFRSLGAFDSYQIIVHPKTAGCENPTKINSVGQWSTSVNLSYSVNHGCDYQARIVLGNAALDANQKLKMTSPLFMNVIPIQLTDDYISSSEFVKIAVTLVAVNPNTAIVPLGTDSANQVPGGVNPSTSIPVPVSNGDFSQGSGGATGSGEGRSSSGIRYLYDVPTGSNAYGLLVLLHGSSSSNYTRMVSMMSQVASKYSFIRVSVLAPNGRGWNEGNQTSAADALHQALQKDFLKKYNIDKNKVFFSGQSSGAGFLSSHFVAKYANQYKGGAFMLCGAARPRVDYTPTEDTKKNFKLHFEITTGDGIWTSSFPGAVSAYKTTGMSVSSDNTKRGGHCSFSQSQVILDHIKKML